VWPHRLRAFTRFVYSFSKNEASLQCRSKLDEVHHAVVALHQGKACAMEASLSSSVAEIQKRVAHATEAFFQAMQHASGASDKAFEQYVKVSVSHDLHGTALTNSLLSGHGHR
jgi:hypothetical protein